MMTKIDRLRIKEKAAEIVRMAVHTRHRDDLDDAWFGKILAASISSSFEEIEDRVEQIFAITTLREDKLCGYAEPRRSSLRSDGIRSFTGHGFGCDICHGGGAATEFSLRIGGYRGRLLIDLCRPCGVRLAQVVDARLSDGRKRA